MMTWETWAAFVAIEFVLVLMPGPAVLYVVSTGLRHGGQRSIWANLGILSGNAFYFLLSAVGLGAVLLASRDVFVVVKWCGAAYLIYLGLRLIVAPGREPIAESDSAMPDSSTSSGGILRAGFVLQAANPKALLFFAALLPQFIDPSGGVAFQVAILAISSIVMEFAVLLAYGLTAGRLSTWARRTRVARATDRVAGTLLIGAGVGLGLTGNR